MPLKKLSIEVSWQVAADIATGVLGGALVVVLLAGQVYAWIERRRADWVGVR